MSALSNQCMKNNDPLSAINKDSFQALSSHILSFVSLIKKKSFHNYSYSIFPDKPVMKDSRKQGVFRLVQNHLLNRFTVLQLSLSTCLTIALFISLSTTIFYLPAFLCFYFFVFFFVSCSCSLIFFYFKSAVCNVFHTRLNDVVLSTQI